MDADPYPGELKEGGAHRRYRGNESWGRPAPPHQLAPSQHHPFAPGAPPVPPQTQFLGSSPSYSYPVPTPHGGEHRADLPAAQSLPPPPPPPPPAPAGIYHAAHHHRMHHQFQAHYPQQQPGVVQEHDSSPPSHNRRYPYQEQHSSRAAHHSPIANIEPWAMQHRQHDYHVRAERLEQPRHELERWTEPHFPAQASSSSSSRQGSRLSLPDVSSPGAPKSGLDIDDLDDHNLLQSEARTWTPIRRSSQSAGPCLAQERLGGQAIRSRSEAHASGAQDAASDEDNDGDQPKSSYKLWTQEEDTQLRRVIETLRKNGEAESLDSAMSGDTGSASAFKLRCLGRFWNKVASHIPNRTAKQCRDRWKNSLDPSILQTAWTIDEDMTLLLLHSEIGNKWKCIANRLPGRTENGVKTRFKSIARARKRQWTSQEDALLLQLYRQHGPRWQVIREQLPGRTLHGIKMRYRALISGTTHKPLQLGCPEQSLDYDFRTYFQSHPKGSSPAGSQRDSRPSARQDGSTESASQIASKSVSQASSCGYSGASTSSICSRRTGPVLCNDAHQTQPVTRKRDLIELLMNAGEGGDDQQLNQRPLKLGASRKRNFPVIVPGFTVSSAEGHVVATAPSRAPPRLLSPPSGQLGRSSGIKVNQAAEAATISHDTRSKNAVSVPEESASEPASMASQAMRASVDGKRQVCKTGQGTQQAAAEAVAKGDHQPRQLSLSFHFDDPALTPTQKNFTSTLADLLQSAKTNPEIEEDEYADFENSIAEMLMDPLASPSKSSSTAYDDSYVPS